MGSAASFLAASYYVPSKGIDGKTVSATRLWLRLTAALAITPLPYTFRFLMPTNKRLQALAARRDSLAASDAEEAQQLLDRWTFRHNVRVGIYSVSVLMGLVPLLAV